MQEKLIDQQQGQGMTASINQRQSSQQAPIEGDRGWLTEAYADFKDRIEESYLVSHDAAKFSDFVNSKKVKLVPANSTAWEQDWKSCAAWSTPFCIWTYVWRCTRSFLNVETNSFALVISEEDGAKQTKIYGPGHHIIGYYNRVQGVYNFRDPSIYSRPIISDIGDLMIACVEQGRILHLEQAGHNILLGPGIHVIDEPMTYIKTVSLDQFFIKIGPEKWVTIPDGYDGISVNRGQLRILRGGKQHHLTHAGEKFVKLVPKTLQTDRVPTDIPLYIQKQQQDQIQQGQRRDFDFTEYLKTTTQEGSTVFLDAMVFWVITDTDLAAKRAMEILRIDDRSQTDEHVDAQAAIKTATKHISTLRTTVLRIAKAHLTALVGTTSMGKQSNVATQVGKNVPKDMQQAVNERLIKDAEELEPVQASTSQKQQHNFDILNFLQSQGASLKDLINADLKSIGTKLENICIYSVTPTPEIQRELDTQTKARVDANTSLINVQNDRSVNQIKVQTENELQQLKALSNAIVTKTDAQAFAESDIIKAGGQSEAIVKVAVARKREAEELEARNISQKLATIRETGEAGGKIFQGGSNNFVFGKNPTDIMNGIFQQQQQIVQTKYMQDKMSTDQ